jgi:histidinol dehydrogenase
LLIKLQVPSFVAADLLSQAEHGSDSQVFLLSDNVKIVEQTIFELKQQLNALPRKEIAEKALKNSKAIVLSSIAECIDFSNEYAPEHLILAIKNSKKLF